MKHSSKEHLSKDEQDVLNQLHYSQIVSEIAFTIFAICIFTTNISSAWPVYSVINAITLILSGLLLFVFGTSFSITAFKFSKLDDKLAMQTSSLKNILIITWLCPLLIIVISIIGASTKHINAAGIVALMLVAIFLISILLSLIFSQRLWQRLSTRKRSFTRIITYSLIAFTMLLVSVFGNYSTTEAIEFEKTTVSDSGLELGQSEMRQVGKNGQNTIIHNLIFGFKQSANRIEPTNEITAKGTRRYQYMYCSDGSYRYYTAEQFKNPNVGYTHQSPDDCAKNGNGTETTIADTPPAKTIVQQQSRTPSSFHCYSIYSGSVSCYGY